MDTDSTLTPPETDTPAIPPRSWEPAPPLTPEPTPQKELEALHGEKFKPGVKVFSHGSKMWWKVDGEWYDLAGR